MATPLLAIHGGTPCRKRPWPSWPVADEGTEDALREVLFGGRWTITGSNPIESEPFERRFGRAFAEYNRASYCVPVSSGSIAVFVALRALGVGFGDEVVVPALTWSGCAASVLACGAIPVFVDVDPETLALDPGLTLEAIGPGTRAILAVHPYCTLADLDRLVSIARAAGVPLIEDCSQAHGAQWNGRHVGTFGAIGVFSMHETKVLTCGEGGAAITGDEELFRLMCQLRGDGRAYADAPESPRCFVDAGDIQGHNFCLSEFHSAILLDRLAHLDSEVSLRERNGIFLREALSEIEGARPLARPAQADVLSYWRFVVRLDLAAFGGWRVEEVAEALAAELGIFVIPIDPPIVDSPLYNPLTSAAAGASREMHTRLDVSRFEVGRAREARRTCLRLPHRMLLGDEADVLDIVGAFSKVRDAAARQSTA